MRKKLALKTLFRTPLKTLLSFLLIVAASFALFFRVTDYAITSREEGIVKASFYGVAALDNSVPDMTFKENVTSGFISSSTYEVEDKPWLTEEQVKEFSSLPGVTLADTRYMTAGLVGNYQRLVDADFFNFCVGRFVLEGTYVGYDTTESAAWIELKFEDVTVLAGSRMKLPSREPLKITHITWKELEEGENPRPVEFFDGLKKGSRCLVIGSYSEIGGGSLRTKNSQETGNLGVQVLEGLEEDYLMREDFAFYRELIEEISYSETVYDIVYTSDMRAIPCLNEHDMVIEKGRPLTSGDANACVVSGLFLETHGLSIGDKINIRLGDRMFHQDVKNGTKAMSMEDISEFGSAVELEIVGAYRFTDDAFYRILEKKDWSYTQSTIFVPSQLLPIEVPAGYETAMGEFSMLVEDAHDIRTFQEAAEPLAETLDLALRFSDGGWLDIEGSFEAGALTSFLTAVLYAIGAALALMLAAYLYVLRNKKAYAIMRTFGVSGREAGTSLALPFAFLSVVAIPIGGLAGLSYASKMAWNALATLSECAPDGYFPDTKLPVEAVCGCLFLEMAFITIITMIFLRGMKNTPPLELLAARQYTGSIWLRTKEGHTDKGEATVFPLSARFEAIKLPDMEVPQARKYNSPLHVAKYVLRHMRRGIGKSVASLGLVVVLAAGIGMFVLARIAYQDAVQKVDVPVRATYFSSSSIVKMLNSDLIGSFYCYGTFGVRTDGQDLGASMVITNDIGRYLPKDVKVTYADRYDASVTELTGSACLIGEALAKELNVAPGGAVDLISDAQYSVLYEKYGKEEWLFEYNIDGVTKRYEVVGIVKSDNAAINSSVFAGIDGPVEGVYGQPFPFRHCEFLLSDHERLEELKSFLQELQKGGGLYNMYAPMASFFVETKGLENIKRICVLLETLFPAAVAAAVSVGLLGSGLAILQSAEEAALLRVLGVTKKRAWCMLVLGQVFLCITGIALVMGGLYLYSPGLFLRGSSMLAACFGLYFIGCVLGATAAAMQMTRRRVMELLQVKE